MRARRSVLLQRATLRIDVVGTPHRADKFSQRGAKRLHLVLRQRGKELLLHGVDFTIALLQQFPAFGRQADALNAPMFGRFLS